MTVPIWMVRHGEASASWAEHADPGLSELGWSQARATAESLRRHIPEDVQLISSPKRRARETALPLAEQMSIQISINDVFNEIAAPVPLYERQKWLQAYMGQTWSDQSPAVLTWRQGIIGALQAIEKPAVIFSHFLVINAVVAHIRNATETLQFWPDNGSSHQFAKKSNGELTLIELGRELSTPVN